MLEPAQKLFKIFADKNRLRMLVLLQQRKMCVCEFAFVLGVSQPSISRHLKKMKDAGLIADEQDGLWTNYFLRDSAITHDVLGLIRTLIKEDKVIRADSERLKRSDRTKLCCR